jgi:lipid A disaccharide synthetase
MLHSEIPSLAFTMSLRDVRLAEHAKAILEPLDREGIVKIRSGDPESLLSSATLAIAKSGTGTLELAHAKIPLVIVYRLRSGFERALGKFLLTVPHFSMLNLLARREAVPEILYVREREEPAIARAAAELIQSPTAREAQLAAIAEIEPLFGAPGASARAAEAVLELAEREAERREGAAKSGASPPPPAAPLPGNAPAGTRNSS